MASSSSSTSSSSSSSYSYGPAPATQPGDVHILGWEDDDGTTASKAAKAATSLFSGAGAPDLAMRTLPHPHAHHAHPHAHLHDRSAFASAPQVREPAPDSKMGDADAPDPVTQGRAVAAMWSHHHTSSSNSSSSSSGNDGSWEAIPSLRCNETLEEPLPTSEDFAILSSFAYANDFIGIRDTLLSSPALKDGFLNRVEGKELLQACCSFVTSLFLAPVTDNTRPDWGDALQQIFGRWKEFVLFLHRCREKDHSREAACPWIPSPAKLFSRHFEASGYLLTALLANPDLSLPEKRRIAFNISVHWRRLDPLAAQIDLFRHYPELFQPLSDPSQASRLDQFFDSGHIARLLSALPPATPS